MDAIAIVGMACRLPGAASCGSFWQLLRDGRDAIVETPSDRWNAEELYDPDPDAPGKMNTRSGGFLDQVDHFDRAFFKLPEREANLLDPQHRLLLELAWEALEDAGQPAECLAGQPVGVFVGLTNFDYLRWALSDRSQVSSYSLVGGGLGMAANRLSYHFDFCGPSLAIDTGCSSSLVAVHLACQNLRCGEATLALAGGVSLMLSPEPPIAFAKMKALSGSGKCRAFDAAADGFVFGEGGGLIVLKPLARAEADGDPIHAVIRGGAVNHNGRAFRLISPHGPSQQEVIRRALADAGVAPSQLGYVEANGTGSLMGDAIEAQALGTVLAEGRSPSSRCRIGSVKTNLGNLGPASGIAGLLKVALALKHRQLPASLNFNTPNPHISFDRLPLQVQDTLGAWPDGDGPLLAGVNAFGVGGANASLILEEAPSVAWTRTVECAIQPSRAHLLPLSAASPEALTEMAQRYRDWLAGNKETASTLGDVCYTAAVRRSVQPHRLAVVGRSRKEIVRELDRVLARGPESAAAPSGQRPARRPKLGFVFSGHSRQWQVAARRILALPAFAMRLEEVATLLRPLVPWSPLDVLADPRVVAVLEEPAIAVPVAVAVQVALAGLWQSWGILPDQVFGLGLGQLAADHARGEVSMQETMRRAVHGPLTFVKPAPLSPALAQEMAASSGVLLEIGAQPGLGEAIGAHLLQDNRDVQILSPLATDLDPEHGLLTALGRLFCQGCTVRLNALYPMGRVAALPSYPWQRQRCWRD
jgi:acyl transferase domain-containing protein